MKKLMKAIAFATVMCMLLSTSVFAAVGESAVVADGTIDVTVVATEGTQVALLMVDPAFENSLDGLTDNDIIYIDQQASKGSAAITFADINIGDYTEAAVWVGYEGANGAQSLGKVSLAAGDVTITILEKVDYTKEALGTLAQGALAIIANLEYSLDAQESTSKIIWGLTVNGEKVFSKPQDFVGLNGPTKVAAVFNNGGTNSTFYEAEEVTDVDVIILTTAGEGNELYSDSADSQKKEN